MGIDALGDFVFPLTSLQIGDLQSYLSHLSLFMASECEKIYILVDNRPWLNDLGLRSAHVWQLMVTKSRLSPFANTKAWKMKKDSEDMLKCSSTFNTNKPKKYERWYSLIDAVSLSQKRVLLPVKNLKKTLLLNSELHRTLYGFIVFEVEWADVRGINYLNELQTETSLAIEGKFMRRWEFDSIAQAASCLSLWFSGTYSERLLLKSYLDYATGDIFYDAQVDCAMCDSIEDISRENRSPSPKCHSNSFSLLPETIENDIDSPCTPRDLCGPYKRRKITKPINNGVEFETYLEEICGNLIDPREQEENLYTSDCEYEIDATQYKDVLILFRFNDHDLPFKLRQIITSDMRLLRLLESGLPSWVIFLQSYPVFCQIYRPWMCPLARTLYIMVSIVTVLIGFYDLYKNVPVLKLTASRLCGPLLDWIETWEMVSRIKYLGTMLVLHNFQKAVKSLLRFTRTARSFFSILVQPLAGPLLELLNYLYPFWNSCFELGEILCSFIWIVVESFFSLVKDSAMIIFQPVWLMLSFIWRVVTFIIYPIFWILSETLYAPIRLVISFITFLDFIFTCIFEFLGGMIRSLSSIFQFSSASEVAVSTYEISMLRSLWNDLFSQIFRAVRSILNGLVAFFTACNRHRLSIYNYIHEFIHRLFGYASHPPGGKDSKRTCRVQTTVSCAKELTNVIHAKM